MRLFVALELPRGVTAELARWTRHSLAAGEGIRRLGVESLHATVAFLGERDATEVESIGRCVEEAALPLGELALGAPIWLPPRHPRTLAVELHDDERGGLGQLHGELGEALAAAVGFEPERRRFRPHVTVARLRAGAARGLERELAPTPPLAFRAPALTLYRSELLREGALYTPLLRAEL